ncbi:MAG: hypothetical protein CSA95_02845 [Bacteroidetes bacterium]|nr:MAG: hypothetical protein CSA95_02845 [Bacteroidota bacterium]PIE88756.1 MAG: hypothetical protein CSA04_00270 [Bacteroidota bacterium]
MNVLSKFEIPFKGLSEGTHRYEYEISDSFFDAIDDSYVERGQLTALVTLEKQHNMMQIQFAIHGTLLLTCDRCLDPFEFPVDIQETLIVKVGEQREEESENVLVIANTEYKLILWHHIYEYISLQVPYRKVHPLDERGESTCNVAQLNLLQKLNEEKQADPRWEALKKLKFDDKQ